MFDSEFCNTRKIYGYFMEFSGKFYSFNKLKLNENQQTPPYDLTHTIISKRAMCNMCVRVCVYLRSRICKFWIIHLVFLVGEFWNCITDFSFALFVPCPFFLFALPLCQFIHHPTRFVAKVIFIMNLIRKQQSCGFWPYLANKSDSSLHKEFEKKTNSEKLHSQAKQLINSHRAAKWAFDSCWTIQLEYKIWENYNKMNAISRISFTCFRFNLANGKPIEYWIGLNSEKNVRCKHINKRKYAFEMPTALFNPWNKTNLFQSATEWPKN